MTAAVAEVLDRSSTRGTGDQRPVTVRLSDKVGMRCTRGRATQRCEHGVSHR